MRSGEIYHLENVPGLHGGKPKGRYVVVVSRIEDIPREGDLFVDDIFVVACTASLLPDQEKRAVALPWRRDGQVNTGFRRRTHAVPEWLLKIKPSDTDSEKYARWVALTSHLVSRVYIFS